MKKYTVQLDAKQRTLLQSILTGGKESARHQMHARIVLKAGKASTGTRLDGSTDRQGSGSRNSDGRAGAQTFCARGAL